MAQKIPTTSEFRQDITAVILAGGEGQRAGNRDKGTIVWHGQPLIAHVRDRLEPQVGRILISCNRNADFYASYAATTFPDLRSDYQGPLAGLEAAVNLIDTRYVLIAPCDTPLLPRNLVQRLLAGLLETTADGCFARANNRDHYLCALLRSACLETVGDYLDGGGRAVKHWFAGHRIDVVDFGAAGEQFCNVNDPDKTR